MTFFCFFAAQLAELEYFVTKKREDPSQPFSSKAIGKKGGRDTGFPTCHIKCKAQKNSSLFECLGNKISEESRGRDQLPAFSFAEAPSFSPLCNSGWMWVVTGEGWKGCCVSVVNYCNFGVCKIFVRTSFCASSLA
jgi:hypothetical protein